MKAGIHDIVRSATIVGAIILASLPAVVRAQADADWTERSTAPGVVMATRFDSQAEVDDYTFPDGDAFHVRWETGNKASGGGSLRMDILKTDSSGSGAWVRHLADDEREFGPNTSFYVQFRQFLPSYYTSHPFKGSQFGGPYAGGWKQAIISSMRGSNQLFEVVLQNTDHRAFVQGYNRNSKGSYVGFEEQISTACSGADFVFQNAIDRGFGTADCLSARRTYGGLYSHANQQGVADPETGAFLYYPDEWLTFLVYISAGTFGGGPDLLDSTVKVWAARQMDTEYTLLIDKQVNLGEATDNSGNPFYFDGLWLLPYNTNRDPDPSRADTYTLYDEVIVSTQFIKAPNDPSAPGANVPANISDLVAQ